MHNENKRSESIKLKVESNQIYNIKNSEQNQYAFSVKFNEIDCRKNKKALSTSQFNMVLEVLNDPMSQEKCKLYVIKECVYIRYTCVSGICIYIYIFIWMKEKTKMIVIWESACLETTEIIR